MLRAITLLASIGSAVAGTILWDGRFNDMSSSTDLNDWSWANQVGPYQYYIHGSGEVTDYVNLATTSKNPADTGSTQGAKLSLTDTAYWNGQTMRRTELIPQTTAAINSGNVFYHFSMQRSDTNAPSVSREHQICFFESHFTEMKAGWLSGAPGTSDPLLRWMVGGVTQWSADWAADEWHNIAYEIDFAANTVALWHSTGAAPLALAVPAVAAATDSNGADWHLGVLELPRDAYPDADEDFFFSGVYVEAGPITTDVAGPGGAGNSTLPVVPPSTTLATSTKKAAATSASASSAPLAASSSAPAGAATAPKWGQCGGLGWTGATACVEGSTCVVNGEYYSQCQ